VANPISTNIARDIPYVDIPAFTGIDTYNDASKLQPGALTKAINAYVDNNGMVHCRKGITQIGGGGVLFTLVREWDEAMCF
jgi:hypothetical protein